MTGYLKVLTPMLKGRSLSKTQRIRQKRWICGYKLKCESPKTTKCHCVNEEYCINYTS